MISSKDKPVVIFVLGGPGSGKGTQCSNLVSKYGFIHLSAGELLRAEVDSGSVDGKLISEMIKDGKIVPSQITVSLIRNAMEKSDTKKFLIDGFPRNTENNDFWEETMSELVNFPFLIFFECPEDVLEKRLLKRGELSGRNDDNPESIHKRFITFKNDTLPIVQYYERKGKVTKINGNRNPKEIFDDIIQKLNFEHII